ncbi:CHAP domain-containing protein [Nonomuraea insulae]|uniref:CHAP domain-containing protein n=1 Tax=Nonomuraea insulae TaxID=1616787 RepID=A0ABW1D1H8_9ACTN
MTPEIQKYIELLESQVGYSEKSGSYTKFGKWYGNHIEFDADYSSAPWCDMYLSWAAHKLGYQDWIGQFAWTVRHAEWFKEQGAWGKTPKVGAFVFYDWSGTNKIDNIDHVGIVTKVEHGRIFTIEGNIDGGVAKRKERDTSKVVGYGYPERIKSRLDRAAAKKAEKEASKPGSEPGTLPEEALNSLIPRSEDGTQAPLTSTDRLGSRTPTQPESQQEGQVKGQTPEEAQGRTEPQTPEQTSKETQGRTQASKPRSDTASPQPSASASDSHAASSTAKTPQAGASPTTAKTGKHAKPTTADTEEATAKPLPVHTDASATGPLPAINSPTLIGSAVVAALALLAVAKTRRLRLSAATTAADKPARRAKGRRRRTTTTPITATSRRTATAPIAATSSTVELQESAERLATAAALRSLSAASHHSTTARATHHHAASHQAASHHAASHQADRHTTSRDTARHAAAREAARHSRHRRLETRPFDLASDAAPHRRTGTSTGTGASSYTPAFDSYEPDFDRGRFTFTDETGPLEVVLDTGPLQRVVDTGSFERIFIPGASSAFDAFAPPRSRRGDILDVQEPGASYRGRRRGHTVEEPIAFSPDLPPRGRRHRRSNHDPLPHGTPPRGRRGQDDLVGAAPSGRGRHRA